MNARAHASRIVVGVLALCWLLGTLRALALWSHAPLYAYANSYDQTRYTNCFHFYPDRSADVAPQTNSPDAPYARYRFIADPDPMCYWSSELVFGGATALIWRGAEVLGRGDVHDARVVGALRWLALIGLNIALSLAWLRRDDARGAIANAALLPLLFADPGNTLYLSTFYAEWTALLAAYALFATTLLWREAAFTRRRFVWLALLALLLATSKIQHLLLPLALAAAVIVLDRWQRARIGWRGLALGAGAALGLVVQVAQLHRGGAMMTAIDQYNRTDVVFTALLPHAGDRRALLDELGIDPACAIYSGRRAWEFPGLPETVCRGLSSFTRGAEIATLFRHPAIAMRLAAHGIAALDPWIAKNLGQVEGEHLGTIAAWQASVGRVLHAWPYAQYGLLAAPFVGLIVIGARRRPADRLLELTAMTCLLMLATLAITVLGDGLADVAKQGHLIVNAALAWLVVVALCALRAPSPRESAPSVSNDSPTPRTRRDGNTSSGDR